MIWIIVCLYYFTNIYSVFFIYGKFWSQLTINHVQISKICFSTEPYNNIKISTNYKFFYKTFLLILMNKNIMFFKSRRWSWSKFLLEKVLNIIWILIKIKPLEYHTKILIK